MRFLRGLGGPKPGPVWAGSLDAKGFEAFAARLDDEMRARGWAYRRAEDGLYVQEPDGSERVFGLSNLAQLCGQVDPAEWPGVIAKHFDNMLIAQDPNDDPFADFERARPNLRLRLMSDDGDLAKLEVVRYPIAPGLMAVLTLDLPTSVATVPRDTAIEWGPADELYRLAMDGLRSEPPADRQQVDVRDASFIVDVGDSFFTASRLLMLPEVVDLAGADGAIVAVPTRHALAVHVIRDAGVIGMLPTFAVFARNMAQAGPGTISPNVYWWHAGALTQIPIEIDSGDHVTISPPDAFIELLNEITSRSA